MTELSQPAASSAPVTARDEFRVAWRVAAASMIGVAFGVNGFSYASFGVLVNPVAEAFGKPVSSVSVWVTFLFLGNVVVAPFIGMLADRFGARRVILSSLPVLILTWCLGGTIGPNLWMLYTLAVMVGVVGTGAGPITYGRAVQTWFEAGRGTAMGIMSAGIGLSYLVGPRVMQGVIDARGWRFGFFILGVVHLIPLPFILGWLKEKRETVVKATKPVETGLAIRQVVRMPVFWFASLGFILYGLCAGGVTVNLVPFMTSGGMTRTTAATYMGLLGIFSVTGRIVTGFVIDRLPVGYVCAVILLFEAAAFAAFAHFGASVVIPAISVTGFAFGGEVSCMGYAIARYFGVRHYGGINGVLSVVTGIGVGLGPPFISYMKEMSGSYSMAFYVAAGIAVGSAVFFAIMSLYPYFEDAAPAAKPPGAAH